MFLYVLSHTDLPSPSIVTYGTPWELAHGICPTLTLDVRGSLGGFFCWCVSIQLPQPPLELPRSLCHFPARSGSPFLAEMLPIFLLDFLDLDGLFF